MKGRKIGQIEVTLEEIQEIMNLTKEGHSRKEISNAVKRSVNTVWRYQKKFGLI
jgi:DNA-binding NarL/FixJ family response regulator